MQVYRHPKGFGTRQHGLKIGVIEEFVPDRIKLTAKLDKPSLAPGQSASLQLNALNFFGPPAAGRKYEVEIQVKQSRFTSPQFSDYNFELDNQRSFADKDVREGTTDEYGNAVEVYQVPELYSGVGKLKLDFLCYHFR